MYQLDSSKYLIATELESLTALLVRLKYKEPRNTLMIRLGLATGARASEILNLTKEDITVHEDLATIFIKGIKGSNDREIPLNKELSLELCEYAKDKHILFDMTYQNFRKIWKTYTPSRSKGIHSLRHTFALNLYNKTKDLRLVQYALGHRNIENTMIYARYNYTSTELRSALGA